MAEGERVASSKESVETDSSEVEGSMPGALDVDAGLSVDLGIDQSTSSENAEEKVGEGEVPLGEDAAEAAALAEPLVPVQSYAGADMFETAAAEAKAAYPEGSASAILVGPGDSWVDALSAAGLAASRGPILFTERGYLPEATAEALAELKAKSVVIVGGEAAVKPGVVGDLASMGISLEKRLYGADCYDTQMAVYEYGLDNGLRDASMAIVATASGFGDALSVSPVAFAKRPPSSSWRRAACCAGPSSRRSSRARKGALLARGVRGRVCCNIGGDFWLLGVCGCGGIPLWLL